MKEEVPFDVQVLEHKIQLADPSNPFGQIKSASSLTLRGRTKRLIRPLRYRANPGEDIDDLFDVTIDEIPQGGTGHKGNDWSKDLSSFLPGGDLFGKIDDIPGIGHTAWIRLGRYFVRPGKYAVLLLFAIPDESGPLMRFCCLLVESVQELHYEVFKRVGVLEGSASAAALNRWLQQTIVII